MNKTIRFIGTLLISGMMLTSCLPENSSNFTQTFSYFPQKLNMGYSMSSTGELTMATAPTIAIEEDLTNSTIQFGISSLESPNGATINMASEPIPYTTGTTANGVLTVEINRNEIYFGATLLENFSFYAFSTWMCMRFTINDVNYVITTKTTGQSDAINKQPLVFYNGMTSVTGNPVDMTGFVTKETQYAVSFEDNNMASVYIYKAMFSSEMDNINSVNLVISGLNYTMTTTGYVLSSPAQITPGELSNSSLTAAPQYVINSFSATLPYNAQNGTMNFECSPEKWEVKVTNLEVMDVSGSAVTQ